MFDPASFKAIPHEGENDRTMVALYRGVKAATAEGHKFLCVFVYDTLTIWETHSTWEGAYSAFASHDKTGSPGMLYEGDETGSWTLRASCNRNQP
jgi:hypothetical protein